MNSEASKDRTRSTSPALIFGIAITVLGLALMLDSLGFQCKHLFFRFWPVLLIGIGAARIWSRQGEGAGGYLLAVAGGLLLVRTLTDQPIGDLIGPGLVIGAGIFLVLNALKRHRGVPETLLLSDGFLKGNAVFSAFNRRFPGIAFQGGELTAIFGGFEVDLRQATVEGDTARLDVFLLFGGGDLKVPEGWNVSLQTTAIIGGVNDKTAPAPSSEGARPRLIVTGTILFGGMEIRH